VTVDPRLEPVYARMRAAVASPEPITEPLYAWLRYQIGWANVDGSPARLQTGKAVRPRLCLTACAAMGADEARAVSAAAAVELTHQFSLVHDDIEDGDTLRRGREALWTVVGQAQGINAGDALFAIARRELTHSPVSDALLRAMFERYDAACVRLAEGQFLDLAFETSERVTGGDYVDMVARKTGALLAAASSLGALAGGASQEVAGRMWRFGESVGIAFQIQDDVLGMWGDPSSTGKPVGADLLRGKKSLPVLLALEQPGVSTRLRALVMAAGGAEDEARSLAGEMERLGLRDRCAGLADEHAARAMRLLADMALAAEPLAELERLARAAACRDR
jgi:geranylgeranyl diphosphate synthase, type I